MMSNEEKIELLLAHKDFKDLTPKEREFVIEMLGDEATFLAMKKTDKLLANNPKDSLEPDAKILSGLQTKMRTQRAQTSLFNKVLLFNMPAAASFSLVVLSVFISWLIFSKHTEQRITYVNVVQKDTVRIISKDTVFITKTVFRKSKAISSKKPTIIPADSKVYEPAVSVSMKDKEALETLLVSGTE
jgi:hypothetical protein